MTENKGVVVVFNDDEVEYFHNGNKINVNITSGFIEISIVKTIGADMNSEGYATRLKQTYTTVLVKSSEVKIIGFKEDLRDYISKC